MIAMTREIAVQNQAAKDLASHPHELEAWREYTLEQEDRVEHLKKEVNEALQQAGKPSRYTKSPMIKMDLVFADPPALNSESERLARLHSYDVLARPQAPRSFWSSSPCPLAPG